MIPSGVNTPPAAKNEGYKDALWKRLDELHDSIKSIRNAWAKEFVKSVHKQAFEGGILSLSAKQIAKVEELYDIYCGEDAQKKSGDEKTGDMFEKKI